MKIIITSILAIIFISACYYDSEEYLFPELPGECDTTAISYTSHIQAIIAENCLMCHANTYAASLGGNVMLEDFSDVRNQASTILNSVKHEAGSTPMPQGGNKLVKCDQLFIEAWINQGKIEN